MLGVPRNWSEVTAAWMTTALAARMPATVIDHVDVVTVDHGTNWRARVAVSYSSGEGPPTLFVKVSGRVLHRLALSVLGALATEARLAAAGAALYAEHPYLYAGAFDRWHLATAVVMEDVEGAGGRANDALTPLSVDEVQSGLEGLARLHGAYWDSPLPPSLDFLRPWGLGRAWSLVSAASLAHGLRRLEALAPDLKPPPGVNARRLAEQFRRSAILAAGGEQTVLHGDPHPGNTYATAHGGTGFLDWQLARVGNWSHDLGYFLVGSLDISDRRATERQLIRAYLDGLRVAGAEAPRWDAAWARYRAAPAFGLATWVHTLSFGTFQPVPVCRAMIERFAAAYDDLETGRSAVASVR